MTPSGPARRAPALARSRRCRRRWSAGRGCPAAPGCGSSATTSPAWAPAATRRASSSSCAARRCGPVPAPLVTVGAAQSNHCRMTAAAGAVLGLEVHLVLSGERPARPTGNQLLAELFGAQLHYVGCPPSHWGELEIARERLADDLARRRRHALLDPDRRQHAHRCARLPRRLRRAGRAVPGPGSRRPPSCTRRRAAAPTPGWWPGGRCCAPSGHDDLPPVLADRRRQGRQRRRAGRAPLAGEALALLGADAGR